ncbi:MAG: hypothetical protein QF689_13575 [Candidatus Latescibacteria bacterium]|jgi:hypothetical protein|nr:hypothetical protein [Candidatus Latescibacterota bacterium]
MSLRRLTHVLLLFALLAVLSACGGRVVEPIALPTTEEVPFNVVIDVRDNLVRQYSGAAKPFRPEPAVRFDFRETSRQTPEPGRAIVAGEFLFAIGDGPLRRGRITVFFTIDGSGWTRTGEFRIDEEPVESHLLSIRIRDSVTEKALAGVLVEARRVDDSVRSSRIRVTDTDGLVELEVLTGTFQVRARLDDYHISVSDFIPVIATRQEPNEIHLTPHGADPIQL